MHLVRFNVVRVCCCWPKLLVWLRAAVRFLRKVGIKLLANSGLLGLLDSLQIHNTNENLKCLLGPNLTEKERSYRAHFSN